MYVIVIFHLKMKNMSYEVHKHTSNLGCFNCSNLSSLSTVLQYISLIFITVAFFLNPYQKDCLMFLRIILLSADSQHSSHKGIKPNNYSRVLENYYIDFWLLSNYKSRLKFDRFLGEVKFITRLKMAKLNSILWEEDLFHFLYIL